MKILPGKIDFSSRNLFSLLTAAFIVHNLEEAVSMYLQPAESPVSFIHPPTYSQFLLALSILTIAAITLYVVAMKSDSDKKYLFISTAFAVALLFNVFVPHVFIAVYTLKYTAGLLSALLLNLPLSLILLSKNTALYTSRKQMYLYIFAGFAAAYALFAFAMKVSMLLV